MGKGLYLWRYDDYAYVLAIGWCSQQKAKGRFEGEDEIECVALLVDLSVEPDNMLNLDDDEVRDLLSSLISANQKLSFKQQSKFFDNFIHRLEQKHGLKFAIVRNRVTPPREQHCPEYPRLILGPPICYAVRDLKAVTHIKEMEERL